MAGSTKRGNWEDLCKPGVGEVGPYKRPEGRDALEAAVTVEAVVGSVHALLHEDASDDPAHVYGIPDGARHVDEVLDAVQVLPPLELFGSEAFAVDLDTTPGLAEDDMPHTNRSANVGWLSRVLRLLGLAACRLGRFCIGQPLWGLAGTGREYYPLDRHGMALHDHDFDWFGVRRGCGLGTNRSDPRRQGSHGLLVQAFQARDNGVLHDLERQSRVLWDWFLAGLLLLDKLLELRNVLTKGIQACRDGSTGGGWTRLHFSMARAGV
jgi:hypothetical protein